mgnify:CR=1 FL=1
MLKSPVDNYCFHIVVYQHIHSDIAKTQAGPEFSDKPNVTDFWISIASGIVFFITKKGVTTCIYPIVKSFAIKLPNENDEMFEYKAGKSAAKAWNTIFHAGAALGAFVVMQGKPWHPWFLGGTGQLSDGFLNMPFSKMDYDGYIFGLIIYGHPV